MINSHERLYQVYMEKQRKYWEGLDKSRIEQLKETQSGA